MPAAHFGRAVLVAVVLLLCTPSSQGQDQPPRKQRQRPTKEAYGRIAHMYLHVMEWALTGALNDEAGRCDMSADCAIDKLQPYDHTARFSGDDWPPFGHTMVGHLRLRNIKQLLKIVVREGVPGDFVELGVWRGGSCIYAKAVLDVLNAFDRRVILFDAFESIKGYSSINVSTAFLEVKLDAVKHNFEKYGLMDERVEFFKGMFQDTVPQFRKTRPGSEIAVLRIDGNFYDSHQDALYYLYELVSVGGYVIFDDILHMPIVAQAWEDFKNDQNFTENLVLIDQHSAYFRKSRAVVVDHSKMRPAQDCNKARRL